MKKNIITLIVATLCLNNFAQESTVKKNYQGKDFSMLKHTWKANWITHPTGPIFEYGVYLFRRNFNLNKKPQKYIIYVSADNRYRLFVNGTKVAFGPARSDELHWRYETLDIAPYLVEGQNVVAAEVVNFGEYRHVGQHTVQTAFILQSDSTNTVTIDTRPETWKVIKNQAFNCIPITSGFMRGYYAAGPCDSIQGELHPWGWQTVNFDDSKWLQPTKAHVETAAGRDFLYGASWFLVPRKIPFLEQTLKRLKKVARSSGIKANDDFLLGDAPLIIPANTKATILLDQTHNTTGFPEMIVSDGKGSEIKITYAEALYKKNDNTGTHVQHADANWIKGNRNDIEGKVIHGYYDLIYPDGGDNRFYTTLWWRTYRFIQLDIQTKGQELKINDFYGMFTAYPFKENAKFGSNDPVLSNVWDAAWRTLRLNSTETFWDPYYEQLQYIGDARIEALVSIYVSGDDRLMRQAIEAFDNSRTSDGLTYSRYPSNVCQIIPPFSLLWVSMVHDFYMYRDDPDFVKQFLPGIKTVLEWFQLRLDKQNLLGNLGWWNFTDWADGYLNGIPPGADDGQSAHISLQYVNTLKQAAELFEAFGNSYQAEQYRETANDIIVAVNNQCYDDSKGMFSETPSKKQFSQHTNILAILSDALPKQEQAKLMEKVLTEDGLIMCTLYFKFYLFRALQKTGLGDKYIAELRPWKNIIGQGLTTFPETDDTDFCRSDCHGWSSSPCFDFLHTIAGIYPAEPGFKSVIIEPNFGPLELITATLPHPAGNIYVELKRGKKSKISGSITLPEGLT